MKSILIILVLILPILINAQTTNQSPKVPTWTEADRKYLLDNLIRTKEEILKETTALTKKQWNFKESPDRWSINQIVEHINIWELLFMNEISKALARPSDSTFTYYPQDSVFVAYGEGKQNNALDFTKPFSFAVPLGNNEGKNNVTWFTTMRNESIEYLKKETRNIRLQYDYCSGANVHHYYIMIFNHSNRHLRQIRKVKTHPDFPN